MTAPKQASAKLMSIEDYRITGVETVMTPALAIYPEIVDANIEATLRVMGGDADRWRPHVKTSKLGFIMRRLAERGVTNVKCATTLELQTAAEAGATDILVAYSMLGANARRVRELAEAAPDKRISALVENPEQVKSWIGSDISLFIDLNGGMDRTGLEQDRVGDVVKLANTIEEAGLVFRGLHYYDGQMSKYEDLATREVMAHQGYDQLMLIVEALNGAGIVIEEVITAGTPAFPCTLSYKPFDDAPFVHRASPGTVVYGDFTSIGQLPADYGYRPAAVVVSSVISHPTPNRITCDAGHKAVSADAGVPTCAVLGHPELQPERPSEEHLPIDAPEGVKLPAVGEYLYLVPRHVCPTVNNFDHALLVVDGTIVGVERVTARGREVPVLV
ncbi:MAG TPA: D-TA family PLP-dependent enzyme [Blastocatellia bacterium]|nr:D-TA family PLP-dependent enzyme [Blastocatellia bacterium]